MIDDNQKEMRAMELFKRGESKKASQLQTEFLEEVMGSGEDLCSCPSPCKYHGKCVECVLLHRGHGDHLPNCFGKMVNRRIMGLLDLTETNFSDLEKTGYKVESDETA